MNARTIFPYIFQNAIWVPTRIILKLFLRFEIRGIERLNGVCGPVIFAANHTSELDPILLPAALPWFSPFSPMFYMSRENTFYIQTIFRRIFYRNMFFKFWGAHEAVGGFRDYSRSLEKHVKIIQEGGSICIFPEGKMSYAPGTFHEARGGVGYLAHTTRAIVVPVAINGVHRINFLQFISGRRKAVISFGRPITSDDLFSGIDIPTTEDYKRAAQEIMRRIIRLL